MTYSSSIAMSRSLSQTSARSRANVQDKQAGGRLGRQFAGRGQNAVDFRRSGARLGPISNTVILIVLACLLGLLYLTQVTKTDAYGYSIDKLQTQSSQLKQQNEDLVLASAQMQSLDTVQASPQATAMVPVSPSGTVRE